jgi:hypothetical protein
MLAFEFLELNFGYEMWFFDVDIGENLNDCKLKDILGIEG